MIKKIILHNFQKHKDLCIDFTDGINSIIGKTDKGKSSIIRALQWVCFNYDKDHNLRRTIGEPPVVTDSTWVQLYIDDNIVERGVSNSKNWYKLNDVVFTSFNRSVPKEIENIIKMDSINIQEQFEPPFLIGSSGGEVSKFINSIAGLEKMDTLIQTVNDDIKQCNREIASNDASLEAINSALVNFTSFENLEADIALLDNLYQKEVNAISTIENTSTFIKFAEDNEAKENLYKDVPTLIQNIFLLEQFVNSIKEKEDNRILLSQIIEDSEKEASFDIEELLVSVKELESCIKTFEEVSQKLINMSNFVKEIYLNNDKLKKINEELTLFNQELAKVKVCPLCGSSLGDTHE